MCCTKCSIGWALVCVKLSISIEPSLYVYFRREILVTFIFQINVMFFSRLFHSRVDRIKFDMFGACTSLLSAGTFRSECSLSPGRFSGQWNISMPNQFSQYFGRSIAIAWLLSRTPSLSKSSSIFAENDTTPRFVKASKIYWSSARFSSDMRSLRDFRP